MNPERPEANDTLASRFRHRTQPRHFQHHPANTQTPLARRLPKFGFTNAAFANVFQIVNLSDFAKVKGNVDAESLYAAGLITKSAQIKILAKGELKKAVNVKAHAISAKAKEAIEKAGGKVEIISPKATFKRASK